MKSKQHRNNIKRMYSLRNRALLLIIITTTTLTVTTTAHAPSTLNLSYNIQTQELNVTITHQVANPTTHYISKVEIKKNGVTYNTTEYTEQPDPTSFTYSFPVNATVGDTLEVIASCIQGGSKTTQYTITQQNTNGNDNTSSTPGFELLLALGALFSVIILVRKKKN
jgi:PGF-CTERM motif